MKARLIILILLAFEAFTMKAQDVNIYDLLTEPSLVRPLTVHKGILQVYGGYSHLNGNQFFDASGSRLPFTEAVQSMIEHNYRLDLTYGILEHLEFYAGLSLRNRYETLPSYYIDNRPGIGYEDRTYHLSGISNLDLVLKYRLPVFLQGFDMYVYGGLLTPVSNQQPKAPAHSIILADSDDPASSYQLQYEYRQTAGSPAVFYSTGFKMLYAMEKIGVSVNMNLQNPFSSIETCTWVSRRYGEEFENLRLWYFTKPKGVIYGSVNLEAQPYPWFAVNAGYSYMSETPGWSEVTGQAVSLTRSTAGFATAGFEIQVSTHLRILQQVNIPVNGSNLYSEFGFSTGIIYSLVPLKNLYYK